MSPSPKTTILVTGGSGLVGKAIEHIISTEVPGSRFGKHEGETWIFAGSKDGDLRWVWFAGCWSDVDRLSVNNQGIQKKQLGFSRSTSPPMSYISLRWVCIIVLCVGAVSWPWINSRRPFQEYEIQGKLLFCFLPFISSNQFYISCHSFGITHSLTTTFCTLLTKLMLRKSSLAFRHVSSPTRLPTRLTRPRSTVAHLMQATLAMPTQREWWTCRISEARHYIGRNMSWCALVRTKISMGVTSHLPFRPMCLVHTTICRWHLIIKPRYHWYWLLSLVI